MKAALLVGGLTFVASVASVRAEVVAEFNFTSSSSNIYTAATDSLVGIPIIDAGTHSEWGTDTWANSPQTIYGSGQTLAYASWQTPGVFALFMNTTGYQDLVIDFKYIIENDTARSVAADWSSNGGGSWTSVTPPAMVGGSLGSLYTLDLSAVSAIEDASNVAVRFTLTGAANMKIDDLQVNASPVPEPASASLLGLGAVGLLARRRRA